MIKIKITTPLMIALLIAALAWLARDTGAATRPRRNTPPQPHPAPRRQRRPTPAPATIIVNGDGSDRAPSPSYAEALCAGVTGAALSHIADQEIFEVGREAYEQALHNFSGTNK